MYHRKFISSIRRICPSPPIETLKTLLRGGNSFSLCYNYMRQALLIVILFCLNCQAQDALYAPAVIDNYENGVLAYKNNDRDEAKVLFSKCISEDSSCFEAYYGLGLIHFEEKNFDQSLLNTNQAKALRPFDAKLMGLRGRIYFQKSNYPEA